MIDILFRAKRDVKSTSREWVYGSLISLDADNGYVFICEKYPYASSLPVMELIVRNTVLVDAETVCQYTGMIDINGDKIFDGDILCDVQNMSFRVVSHGEYDKINLQYIKKNTHYKIIGNIYDNPELLNA